MRVVLSKSVPDLGQKGDIKDVKPGYWRNFLMPKDLAQEVTPQLLKQIEKDKQKELVRKKALGDKFLNIVLSLKNKTLSIHLKADKEGTLYAGLGAQNISEHIKENLDLEIPAAFIKLEKPIKKTGSYEVLIKDAVLKLKIQAV